MATIVTLSEFLQEAGSKYSEHMRILANMYKVGIEPPKEFICKMHLANMYIWTLNRLAGTYALDDDEINAIVNHLIIILGLREINPIDIISEIRGTTRIQIIYVTIIVIQPTPTLMYKSFRYNTDPDTRGTVPSDMSYNDEDAETPPYCEITCTHNLNKNFPTVSVTSGGSNNVNIAGITHISGNVCKITIITEPSHSEGVITFT